MFTPPCFTNMKSFIRSEIPHLLTSKAAGGGVCGWRCLLKTKKSAAWETCSCWGNLHVELFSCAQLKCHSMSGLHRWTNKPRLTFWNVPDFFQPPAVDGMLVDQLSVAISGHFLFIYLLVVACLLFFLPPLDSSWWTLPESMNLRPGGTDRCCCPLTASIGHFQFLAGPIDFASPTSAVGPESESESSPVWKD